MPHQVNAPKSKRIENVDDVGNQRIDRILVAARWLGGKAVTLQIDRDCAEPRISDDRQVAPEYIDGLAPAVQEDNGWMCMISNFYHANGEARPKSWVTHTVF